jgi:CheY-like chemotaxis protein
MSDLILGPALTAQRPISLPSILVAEDEINDVILLKRAVEQAGVGVPVRFVRDGAEVFDYLEGKPPFDNRQKFPLPGLLLLDLKMPRVSGWEVLAWLRRQPNLKTLTVAVFSGSNWKADRERALAEGAHFYVTKPVDWGEFPQVIRSIVQVVTSANLLVNQKVA